MLERLGVWAYTWARTTVPWTNVYGLGRSLLALSTLLTLLFNDATVLFRPAAGIPNYPNCPQSFSISLFCLVPSSYQYLNLARWTAVILMLVVVSGWRPRITGILHWWIAYSLHSAALTLDGGEQATAVLSFLLIPATLTDPRRWHWQPLRSTEATSTSLYSRILALTSLVAIRAQVAGIYLHAGVGKLFVEDWVNGTALYYYLLDPLLGLSPAMERLIRPILVSPAVVIPTWGTIILELLLFAALFMPKAYWRPLLWAGIAFHAMIAAMIGIVTFAIAMFGALILYLRPIEEEFVLPVVVKRFLMTQRRTTPTIRAEATGTRGEVTHPA